MNIIKKVFSRISNSGATRIKETYLTDEIISLKIEEVSEKGNFKHLRGERTYFETTASKEEIQDFISYSMSVKKKEQEDKDKREKEEIIRLEKEKEFLSKKIILGEDKDYSQIIEHLIFNLKDMHSLNNKVEVACVVLHTLGEIKLKKIDEDSYMGRDLGLEEFLLEIPNGYIFSKKERFCESTEHFIYFDGKLHFKISFEHDTVIGHYSRNWNEINYNDFLFTIERL